MIEHKSTTQRTVKLFARCCFYAILNYSHSSKIASISMGRLPGSTFMPISSPNSSPSSFVAPFATAG
ncbi:hypothetical protein [Hominenteromicrobium sp.]|uniref:hypothetical protein n=1 Tax=Hominenteromicrobium sp. TaxID=3073581 RepID=UPI003AF180F5